MSRNARVVLELTHEEAEFLMENCNVNLAFGLASLQKLTSQDLKEKMVVQLELFKALRSKLMTEGVGL